MIPTNGGGMHRAMAEINVTPMVDVMLVLLVIFMITVPVIQSGISVDVPRTHSTRQLTKSLLVVTVDSKSNVYINDTLTNYHALAADLKKKMAGAADQEIYVRADQNVSWGTLALVMDAINRGGLTHVDVVTQPYDEPVSPQP